MRRRDAATVSLSSLTGVEVTHPRILNHEYDKAIEEYQREWSTLDAALYRLCREHPGHASSAGVFAEVFIIGRTYQTGIERQVKSTGGCRDPESGSIAVPRCESRSRYRSPRSCRI